MACVSGFETAAMSFGLPDTGYLTLTDLTDQMRRSSRSVCANVAEAWRKRIYEAAFVSKINDAEAGPPKRRTGLCSP